MPEAQVRHTKTELVFPTAYGGYDVSFQVLAVPARVRVVTAEDVCSSSTCVFLLLPGDGQVAQHNPIPVVPERPCVAG